MKNAVLLLLWLGVGECAYAGLLGGERDTVSARYELVELETIPTVAMRRELREQGIESE